MFFITTVQDRDKTIMDKLEKKCVNEWRPFFKLPLWLYSSRLKAGFCHSFSLVSQGVEENGNFLFFLP